MRVLVIIGLLAIALGGFAQEPKATPAEILAEADRLQAEWRAETDSTRREQLGEKLADLAVYGGVRWAFGDTEEGYGKGDAKAAEIIDEITADGRLATSEIVLDEKVRAVPLTALRSLGELEAGPNGGDGWVIRRMTETHFELWTPKHGWLFNRKGELLREARPPRRDGQGREWYGAFLPDGCWITTDLWERDDTLTLFSRTGKWLREWPTGKLLPTTPQETDQQGRAGLIGWARSDKQGRGWVVSIGSEGGRGCVWLNPKGEIRVLDRWEPWKLCYPNALGAKGMYLQLEVPDPLQELVLERTSAGHGSGVGYPVYHLQKAHALAKAQAAHEEDFSASRGVAVMVADGERNFGFWPRSSNWYVVAQRQDSSIPVRTWFFDASGRFQRWIRATRLADAADQRAILLRTSENVVATLNPDYIVAEQRRFTWKHEQTAEPIEIFDDLRLGFFRRGKEIVLARWAK